MFHRRARPGQPQQPLVPEPESVNLTPEELRAISGGAGISLNIEIENKGDKRGHSSHHAPHDFKP
jgi:hypothetical protein